MISRGFVAIPILVSMLALFSSSGFCADPVVASSATSLTQSSLATTVLTEGASTPGLDAPPAASQSVVEPAMRVGVGVNYPGLGVKLAFRRWMLEARGQYESEVWLAGGRCSYEIASFYRLAAHAALEADYARYTIDGFVASGYPLGVFLVGEYYLTSRMSLQLDFGPAYVSLKGSLGAQKETGSGVHYVTGFGLTYYFGNRGLR